MTEHHDENTLKRVYLGLQNSGLTPEQASDAVSEMQNQGVLFRERNAKVTDFQLRARILVANYVNETTEIVASVDKLHVVWFSKTLQNWKALVTFVPPTGWYYEVTYDGENEVTYIDAYNKVQKIAVPD